MKVLKNLDNALEQIDCGDYNNAMSSICEAREYVAKAIQTLETVRDNPEWQDHHCRAEATLKWILD